MYKKTQIGKGLNIILISIFILLIIIFSLSKKTMPTVSWIFTVSIFTIIIALFFKLTVIVDEKYVRIIFGIGLIPKKYLLSVNIISILLYS